jgi:maltooligosyltrehalose trehalohydrolase
VFGNGEDAAQGTVRSRRQRRRLPVGADIFAEGGTHFRVWAPRARQVEVVFEDAPRTGPGSIVDLEPEGGGYFSGAALEVRAGALYRYRLENDVVCPDPAARFQPDGPHGPSMVIDPVAFRWTDHHWRGAAIEGQVVYEMHIGTFTREGTWAAAMRELPELARIGITLIEVMPVADFAGRFGWGYDGVNLFSPTRLYGSPDDFRRFVNTAHSAGVGVILDVVYNHLGPEGNYLDRVSPYYASSRHTTDWGAAINYDGEHSSAVREYVIANAGYWIEEFHLDGLRLDATQDMHDDSAEHILIAIGRRVHQAGGGKQTVVIAENEPQHVRLVRSVEAGGYGLDGLWNDDFHHSASVALTGRREAYYTDYRGTPQEFVSAFKRGLLFQGQRYAWQKKARGMPTTGVRPAAFVVYTENHDQLANSLRGLRSHARGSPGRYRVLTALLLLAPGTPMLFQGQEFAASSPFLFFSDLKPELAPTISAGRKEFLQQFKSLGDPAAQAHLPDPADPLTFERCKLDLDERGRHREAYALHQDLLRLRRDEPVFHAQRLNGVDGAVLGAESFVLRFFGDDGDDRLMLVNIGADHVLEPVPEPLVAPPAGQRWEILWSTEAPRYGGAGMPALLPDQPWIIPAQSAIVLRPARMAE